jgi:hypothetical protein
MVEKDFEITDGKKVPLRHFILDLTSYDITLLCLSIAGSFLCDIILKNKADDIMLDKIKIYNRFADVMGVSRVDPVMIKLLEGKVKREKYEK